MLVSGGGGGAVASVNGYTGIVVLDATDVSAMAYSDNLNDLSAVTPGTTGKALLDDTTAAAARTTLGLGTIATATAAATPDAYASALDSIVAALGTTIDYCALTAIPDFKTNPPAGSFVANTTQITADLTGGVITWTRSNTGADGARASALCPYWSVEPAGVDMLTARVSCTGGQNYEGGGLFTHNNYNCGVYFFVYTTVLEFYDDVHGVIATAAITQSAYIWQRLIRVGNFILAYYSTSTARPTAYGPTAATHWVFLGHRQLPTNTGATCDNKPLLGFHTVIPAGANDGYALTMTALEHVRLL